MTTVILITLLIALAFAVGGYMGAPYVPILRRDTEAFFALASLKPGQTLIDLGSGDGRLLRIAAAQGIRSIGYEINPIMVLVSRLVCWRYRHLVTIHLANIWHIKLPPADAVYVFLMPKFMPKLHQFLTSQITRPTHVISYAFEIPGRPIAKRNTNTYLYEYGSRSHA